MALMMGRLYQALIDAKVSPDQAREAAEEVATFEGLRTEIRVVQAVLGIVVILLGAGIWQLVDLKSQVASGFSRVESQLKTRP